MGIWIKNKLDEYGVKYYPECSECGYHWIEQCMEKYSDRGYSNIIEAHYCPNCGSKMEGVVDYNEIHR